MKKALIGLLSIVLITGLVSVCCAEEAANKVTYGGDIRIRGQVTKNIYDLNNTKAGTAGKRVNAYDNEQFYRHRTRLWIKGELEEGMTGYVRLAVEPRWGRPDYTYNDATVDAAKKPKPEWTNHLIIDNSYIEAKKFLGSPLNLKIGRQDLTYGEGFLVYEGTPVDGSRTIYFDAVKLSLDLSVIGVDLFTAKPDEGQYNINDDEDLYGLYTTLKMVPGQAFDVYVLQRERRAYKLDQDFDATTPDIDVDSSTTAVGVRASGKIIENLTYAAEVTKEFGSVDWKGFDPTGAREEGDMDRDAIGGLATLTYAIPVPTQPTIKLGAYYTSGDNENTDDYEAWDGFYSEFPKYGYGDMLASLTKLDYDEGTWTNHRIYEADLKLTPISKMTANLGFLYLAANNVPDGVSKKRGICPQARLEYQFTPAVTAHVLGQYFQTGNYYEDSGNHNVGPGNKVSTDDAFFGRFEMSIKF
ncbi:MAG: alginate export family protein [bacterium]